MFAELKEVLAKETHVIGVLGAIGSGKSTLSRSLSENLDVPLIEENFPQNPYLAMFYRNPQRYSFRSQAWFLKSTVDQLMEVEGKMKGKSIVLDPANEMNLIYAKTHYELGWMSETEFSGYLSLYQILTEKSGIRKPDVFVWLDVDRKVLSERVQKRGRPYELKMLKEHPEYLYALNENVKEFAQGGDGKFIFGGGENGESLNAGILSKGILGLLK